MGARPLFGRSDERAALLTLVDDVHRDGVQVVLVEGPAGIGKSHLVRNVVEQAARSAKVVTVGWREDATMPAAPMQGLAERLLGPAANAELPWVAEPRTDVVGIDGAGRASMARCGEIARALSERLAALGTTALVFEDLHWSDELSLELLDGLLERLLDDPVAHRTAIVITRRTSAGRSRDDTLVDRWERSPRCTRLVLGPLSPLDEYALVRAEVGRAVAPAVVDAIRRSAQGVPLDVRAGAAAYRAFERHAEWYVAPSPGDVAAAGQPRPLSRWLVQLDQGARDALSAAAVWGDAVTADTLVIAGTVTWEAAVKAIDAAVVAGVLEWDADGYRFAHARVRSHLVAQLPDERRRMVHRLAMDRPSSLADPVERAAHCVGAGPLVDASERLQILDAAGRACAQRGAWVEAERLLEQALGAAVEAGTVGATLVDLRFRAGYAHFCNHDIEAAERRLREVLEDSSAELGPGIRAATVMALYRVRITSRRSALKRAPRDRALDDLIAHSPSAVERALGLGLLAEALVASGQTAAAVHAARQAVAEAEDADDDGAKGRAWFAYGLARASELDHAGSAQAYARSLVHAEAAEDAIIAGAVDTRLPLVLLGECRLAEAEAVCGQGLRRARRDANYINQSLALGTQSSLHLLRGQLERAAELAAQSLRAAERASYPPAHLLALVPGLMALRFAGRVHDADELEDEWREAAAGSRPFVSALRTCSGERVSPDQVLSRYDVPAESPLALGRALAAAEVAVHAGDVAVLRSLLPALRSAEARGARSTPYWPVLVPRVIGEALLVVGEDEGASIAYLERALRIASQHRAATEVARTSLALGTALLGRSDADDRGVQLCASSLDLAGSIGLPIVERTAGAVLRLHRARPTAGPEPDPDWRVLLMADLANSTALSIRSGDRAYAMAVDQLRGVVRTEVGRCGGSIVDEAGDGILACFRTVSSAEVCALSIVDALVVLGAGSEGPAVRVALTAGRPYLHDGRPVGSLVNLVARLCASARPGQIIVDESVAVSAGPDGRYEALGPLRLKGIPGRVPAFALEPA